MRISVAARAAIGVAVVASLAAGCSSSKKSSNGGNTNSAPAGNSSSAKPATGSPITLMIMAVKNTPVLSQQEQFGPITCLYRVKDFDEAVTGCGRTETLFIADHALLSKM